MKQLEELCRKKGNKINDNNFFYPIRKEVGIDLNIQKKHFNDVFSSFKSIIENQFCELYNKFKRFSNNNSAIKTDDYKYASLQLKVAFLLKNIKRFSEHVNIIIQDHHKLWSDKNFEVLSQHKLIDIVLNNQIKYMKKLKIMSNLQKEVMSLEIGEIDNSMIIDDITDYITDDDENSNDDDESDVHFSEY